MKRIGTLLAVIFTVTAAQADLTLQQQVTDGKNSSAVTVKIKGTKIRADMYVGQPQALSTISDAKTGERTTLLHTQKMFIKESHPPAATKSAPPQIRDTGKKEKVGGYDTEIYTWINPRGLTGFAWVTKTYPNFEKIRADLAILDSTDGTSPALSTLPGMVVKTQISGGGEMLTVTLVSVKMEPVDVGQFQTPAGYHDFPKLQPAIKAPPPKKPAK